MKNILTLIPTLLIVWSVTGSTLATSDLDKIKLTEALERISQYYDVYFTYDRDLTSQYEVNFVAENYSSAEEAIQLVLQGTNLAYQIFDDQFVIVYLDDKAGLGSVKKMITHLQGFVDKKEKDGVEIEKRATRPITKLLTPYQLMDQLEPFALNVNGRVIDADGKPLIGVNILVQGTNEGTTTDLEGRFTLNDVDEQAVLVLSYIGYKSQEVGVDGRTDLTIIMLEDVQTLDEVVVVGYGTQKKSDLTGAVHRVDAENFENQSTTSLIEMLNGTVAGFSSNQGTSAEGGGSLEVRGPTSIKANNSPLIVLDGVIYNGNIGDINPIDIQSIDILKDASAAAVYGARSAAGVVIVTTKRGLTGKPTINFSTKVGFTGITNHKRPQTPEQYLTSRGDYWADVNQDKPDHYYTNPNELPDGLSQEEWKNFDPTPSDDVVQMWLDRMGMTAVELENYKAGKTVDWYDLVYRNGLRQSYDLSLSGGLENLHYYWSIGYTDNEGVQLGDDFNTIRSRVNLEADVTDFLKVGINTQYTDRDKSSQPINFAHALRASPFGNIYVDGTDDLTLYPHNDRVSPNPLTYYTYRDKLDIRQDLFASLYGEITLPWGIRYRATFVNRYDWSKDHHFDPINTPAGIANMGIGYRIDESLYEWQIDNILSWHKSFTENHEINVTLLANAEKYQSWESDQQNSAFAPSGALSYHGLQSGINPNLGNNDQYSTGNAFMARLNYDLLQKYLVTLTWRRDGYSAFGQQHPYATFPSAAIAWRISEEPFFDIPWMDYTKIRASCGVNGNRAIDRYDALSKLGTTKYIYGNTLATGVYNSTLANSALKWERTEAINVGIDFSIHGGRLNGSMDFYDMTTYDLLLNRSLPRIIGYTSVAANLGELQNRGFELTLNTVNFSRENLGWNTGLVFSLNRNKIIHLYGDMIDEVDAEGKVTGQREADDIGNGWFIGHALDQIWDYEILGVWQLEEVDEAAKYGKQPGDFKLRDVNQNDNLTPTDDKVFQGYKKPLYKIGLRNDFRFFKNFELSTFIRADLGFYGKNNLHRNSGAVGKFERNNRIYTPYWTLDNPINDYARLNSDTNSPNFNYWESRSFVRLQDISISYNVPSTQLTRFKIQDLEIFISSRNLLTFTKWKHYDPESQTDMMPKIFTGGINVTL